MKRTICEMLLHFLMAIGIITMLSCVNEKKPLVTFLTLFVGAVIFFGANFFDSYIHYLKGTSEQKKKERNTTICRKKN